MLKGYILVGDAGKRRCLYRHDPGGGAFVSVDFELLREKPQLMAFSAEKTGRCLAGRPERWENGMTTAQTGYTLGQRYIASGPGKEKSP